MILAPLRGAPARRGIGREVCHHMSIDQLALDLP
jgi:hypothetical protein